MVFEKGHKSFHTYKSKQNLSIHAKLHKFGKHERTEEVKNNMYTKERSENLSKSLSGRKLSEEHRKHLCKKKCRGKTNVEKEFLRQIALKKVVDRTHNFLKSNRSKNWLPPCYIDGRSRNQTWARYGDDWFKIRHLILIRDKFTCQDCGKSNCLLHIHHKEMFMINKNNSLNNLITLCPQCHRKRDYLLIRKIKQKTIKNDTRK
jgi:5-methylcytosine-specific restriction endonuclease McrA